jgi:hypothetical protein
VADERERFLVRLGLLCGLAHRFLLMKADYARQR